MRAWPGPFDAAGIAAFVERTRERYERFGRGYRRLVHRRTGETIGLAGVLDVEIAGGLAPSLGYIVSRARWRRGYAIEAAQHAMRGHFIEGHDRILSLVRPGNHASIGVAQALGLTPGEMIPYAGFDHIVFGRCAPAPGLLPVDVRPERLEDHDAIDRVLIAAFPTDAEARLVRALRTNGSLVAAFVAEWEDEIAAYAAASPVALRGSPGGPALTLAGLAPVAVAPHLQRRGAGFAVASAVLTSLVDRAFDLCVVLGDPAQYRRHGFVPAARHGIDNEYGAGDAFRVLELTPGALDGAGGTAVFGREFADL